MKLVTFSVRNQTPRVGILEDDTVVLTASQGSLLALMQSGITPTRTSERYPLETCVIHPPLRPGKILCVGRNYAEHAKELGNAVPDAPLIFLKAPSAVIASGETITWRGAVTQQVDWEGELAVVMGKRCKNVSEADAPRCIYGYTIANDVSARDLQDKEPQWARAKSLDTFCPLGPVLVTRSDIPDPQALRVRTEVNGEVMQDGSTADMMHGVYALVSYVSQWFTLEPGDVILTGTPSGVGKGRKPPLFLKDGDVVSVTIDGIGTLRNPCKVEDA